MSVGCPRNRASSVRGTMTGPPNGGGVGSAAFGRGHVVAAPAAAVCADGVVEVIEDARDGDEVAVTDEGDAEEEEIQLLDQVDDGVDGDIDEEDGQDGQDGQEHE